MMTEETAATAPDGFKSAEAKKQFTIGAIIVGVLGFLAPMFLPLLMIPVMMAISFNAIERGSSAEIPLRDSAYWTDRVWFIDKSESTSVSSAGSSTYFLKSATAGDQANQVKVETTLVVPDEPQLLAAGDRLWLLSESTLGYFRDQKISILPPSGRRGDLSVAFLFDGKPAALELLPDRTNLLVIENDAWVVRTSGRLSLSEKHASMKQVRGVQADGALFLFMKCGETIFTSEWISDSGSEPVWSAVTKTDSHLDAVAIADRPVLIYYHDGWMSGLQKRSDTWSAFCDVNLEHEGNFRVFPGATPGSALMIRNVNGKLQLSEIVNGALADKTTSGSRLPENRKIFPAFIAVFFGLIWCLFLLIPIAMLLALTVLMKKHRIAEYRIGDQTVEFASLLQRGIATLIDTTLFGLPAIVGMVYFGWKIFPSLSANTEPPASFVWAFFGVIAGGFLFSLIGQVFLSFMEGRWGTTPGKRLCRIQVLNLELKPCGFWRAILRRLLLIADGFFSYLVGMMLIGFMPKWQRLGDLAVGTIVVRKH